MKFLFDTDHLTILQRRSGSEFLALARRIDRHPRADFVLSVVSLHEQFLGCHAYINAARQVAKVVQGYGMLERVLRGLSLGPILPFDIDAASVYETLAGHRPRVATMDLRIASIALSRGLTLLTRNAGDFGGIPGLATEDWTA